MGEFIGIGNILKKIYRAYSLDILKKLEALGHVGLTFSYLEVLSFICENEGTSLKGAGSSLGLKKQTITNHMSELEKRGYIFRQQCPKDRRSQLLYLTELGLGLKNHLFDSITEIENDYANIIGGAELERLRESLSVLHSRLERRDQLF
jgi:DNA-binding MarR family transcriptional regulator